MDNYCLVSDGVVGRQQDKTQSRIQGVSGTECMLRKVTMIRSYQHDTQDGLGTSTNA